MGADLGPSLWVYLPQEQTSYEEQVIEQEKEGILHALGCGCILLSFINGNG